MSVSFSLAKHLAKPGDKTSDSKYYACTQINDSISLKMFAGLIEKQTTVSRADCTAVLVSAVDNLVTELQRGNQVEFGELGKFRLQLTSTGVDNPADFRSDVNITGANIQYIPGEGVKNKFTDLDYKQVASRALQIAAMKAEKAGAKTINIEEAKKYKKDEAAGDGTDVTESQEAPPEAAHRRAPAALVRTVAAHRRALAALVRIPATPARIQATATM